MGIGRAAACGWLLAALSFLPSYQDTLLLAWTARVYCVPALAAFELWHDWDVPLSDAECAVPLRLRCSSPKYTLPGVCPEQLLRLHVLVVRRSAMSEPFGNRNLRTASKPPFAKLRTYKAHRSPGVQKCLRLRCRRDPVRHSRQGMPLAA